MKKIHNTLLFSLLFSTHSFATETANNSVYLELGGNSVVYSINYERNFDTHWGWRVGLGSVWVGDEFGFGVPVLVNKYWGAKDSNHKFETGIGFTYFSAYTRSIFEDDRSYGQTVVGTASIGYRYLPKTEGLTYKVAFTPLIQRGFLPWVGFSVGYAF